MNFVFWQPTLSIHQAPMLRALAAFGHDVHLVCDADVSPARRRAGWQQPDYGDVEVHLSPSALDRRRLERRFLEANLHVFSGLGSYPMIHSSLQAVTAGGGMAMACLEGPDPDGLSGLLRSSRARRLMKTWAGRLAGLLAVGSNAAAYYKSHGFPKERVYTFGYFMDGHQEGRRSAGPGHHARAIFVGSLVARKRPLELALTAARVERLGLDYIGDGPLRDRLQRLTENGDQNVLGTLPNEETRCRMAQASFLILPSRHDGWGAVVSESLLAGTPVLVSAGCGASDLVVSPQVGVKVSKGLQSALAVMFERSSSGAFDRGSIARWAQGALSGEAGAEYLCRIVKHLHDDGPRPCPPWADTTELDGRPHR